MTYALDTNIFIDGFRSEEAQTEVFAFLNRALPFTYLSAVVMQGLSSYGPLASIRPSFQRGYAIAVIAPPQPWAKAAFATLRSAVVEDAECIRPGLTMRGRMNERIDGQLPRVWTGKRGHQRIRRRAGSFVVAAL